MKELAPIVLFVYNRPEHTRRCLKSLMKNEQAASSTLFIFCDGPKENATAEQRAKIDEVRKVAREKKWCGQVHISESATNKGLANSLTQGITEIVNRYGKIIVLEDDLVLSEYFLAFMNSALEKYDSDEKVMVISGFSFPLGSGLPSTYFLKTGACWGWATWQRAWKNYDSNSAAHLDDIKNKNLAADFNFNNSSDYYGMLNKQASSTIDSWAINWYASVFLKGGLTLYPAASLAVNEGFESGTHFKNAESRQSASQVLFSEKHWNELKFSADVSENAKARKRLEKYFRTDYPAPKNIIRRIGSKIKRAIS
jgi:hypothetical protein